MLISPGGKFRGESAAALFRKYGTKPNLTPLAPAFGYPEAGRCHARKTARCGVAKALADIIAPEPRVLPPVAQSDLLFLRRRGLAQFVASAPTGFVSQNCGELTPPPIAETRPNEVKNLVQQNQPQLARTFQQLRFQHDPALAHKRGRVDGRAGVVISGKQTPARNFERGRKTKPNWIAGKRRKILESAADLSALGASDLTAYAEREHRSQGVVRPASAAMGYWRSNWPYCRRNPDPAPEFCTCRSPV